MASTHLTRTPGSGVTSRYKGTLSVWVKRAKVDEEDFIYNGFESSSNQIKITFKSNAQLQINTVQAGSNRLVYETNRKFRDINAWYHIVVAIDTTLGTAGDRVRLYINGIEETSFSTETHIAQNSLSFLTEDNQPIYIGAQQGSANYFDGSMSHFHLIDGQQYAPTVFGETDATTGEWKIKTNVTATYGNHGFFILKDGNSVTDQSGNGNNFTISGTLTKTEDCPSNVFATWYADSFDKGNQVSFTKGNTTTADAGGTSDYDPKAWTTFGANAGKYYCEMKLTAFSTGRSYRAGVWFTEGNFSHESNANSFSGVKYTITGNAVTIYSFGSDVQSNLASFSAGDILGVAVDIDNGTIQYYKNGSAYGTQITGLSSNFSGKSMMFCHTGEAGGGRTFTIDANFGNGYFGSTQISSAGTNASGNGIFEYDVPSGFTALSTKGLNL